MFGKIIDQIEKEHGEKSLIGVYLCIGGEIKKTLNPIQGINLNYIELKQNSLILNASNLQRLPVEIIGIQETGKNSLEFNKSIYLKGTLLNKAVKPELIKNNCGNENLCKKENLANIKIIYKILGQNEKRVTEIAYWSNTVNSYLSNLYEKIIF